MGHIYRDMEQYEIMMTINTYESLFGSADAAQQAHQHGTPDPTLARHVVVVTKLVVV